MVLYLSLVCIFLILRFSLTALNPLVQYEHGRREKMHLNIAVNSLLAPRARCKGTAYIDSQVFSMKAIFYFVW